MNIKPIKKVSLCDYVIDQIKQLIISGELEVGQKIPPERELAELFNVSRSSVREAMKVLSLQGLVKRTNSGTVISSDLGSIIEETFTLQILLNQANFKEIFETRRLLEKELVFLTATRRTDEELCDIEKEVSRMELAVKNNDMELFLESDLSFHQQIALASQNTVLLYLYNAISDLVLKALKQVSHDRSVMDTSFNYHKKIYELIKNKDGQAARVTMEKHLHDAESRVVNLTIQEILNMEEVK